MAEDAADQAHCDVELALLQEGGLQLDLEGDDRIRVIIECCFKVSQSQLGGMLGNNPWGLAQLFQCGADAALCLGESLPDPVGRRIIQATVEVVERLQFVAGGHGLFQERPQGGGSKRQTRYLVCLMFVETPDASARDVVHVVLCGEMVRPDDLEPNPDIDPGETADHFRTLPLERLVRMKLNSYRRKDQVHLLDMISVGLIDSTWPTRFAGELGQRLQRLLDDPDG